jgi:hypothetical protein
MAGKTHLSAGVQTMSQYDKPLIDPNNPDDAALAADRDAFNRAIGWQPPAQSQGQSPVQPQVQSPAASSGPRQHWKKVDWRWAAQLMAGGATIEAAAVTLGCEPDRLLRNLRRSAKFRHRIDREVERMKLSARLRFAALGEDATRQMQRQAHDLDPRLLQWLGDKLNLNREFRATMGEQWAEAVRAPERRKPVQTGRNGT